MIIQSQIENLPDGTKLVRFLDKNGGEKTVGSIDSNGIHCTFHYGLLSHYRNSETNARDTKEGSTLINFGNDIMGSETTCNNALVSCWSILDGQDPWESLGESSFAKGKEYICAITSTIGKVRRIFNQTIKISEKLLGDYFSQIVYRAHDKKVTYYPRASGLDHDYWKKITNVSKSEYGIWASTMHNIFHKQDSNEEGLRYDTEKEYRFAIVLGERLFSSDEKNIENIALSSEGIMWRDFPLVLTNCVHYIDKVYLSLPNTAIENTCFHGKIPIEKPVINYK